MVGKYSHILKRYLFPHSIKSRKGFFLLLNWCWRDITQNIILRMLKRKPCIFCANLDKLLTQLLSPVAVITSWHIVMVLLWVTAVICSSLSLRFLFSGCVLSVCRLPMTQAQINPPSIHLHPSLSRPFPSPDRTGLAGTHTYTCTHAPKIYFHAMVSNTWEN